MHDTGKILVVDDEQDVAALMSAALTHEGHDVVASSSPAEALGLVAEDDFDVVVTDIAMNGLNGIELCERILGTRPETPVVLITGHGSMSVAVDALRVGACDFITKPLEVDMLRRAVARALQKRRLLARVRRVEVPSESADAAALLGSSEAIQRVYAMVARIATSQASVLIRGETGSGKELVARAIHAASGSTGRFVALNCAAVTSTLLESELFGHARGAYTDARTQRNGLFVEADGGTIFLDEIADMPLDIQPKLLRALQERKVRPVGANTEVPFDARLITATNRPLEQDVADRRFREDLYYRINVVKLDVPPLRERGSDVVELAEHFLAQIAARTGRPVYRVSSAAAAKLVAHSWPGNVRELENCMERAVVVARFEEISVEDLPEDIRAYSNAHRAVPEPAAEIIPILEVERAHIVHALELVKGNKVRAARALGVDRRTLYRKLARFGISTDAFKGERS